MKLRDKSISAKLYRWFYATNSMPQSLCPYFWKLIIMWFFILPYSILSLPIILIDLRMEEERSTWERAGVGFIIWFILAMIICMLSWFGLFFAKPEKDGIWSFMLVAGFIGWGASIVLGIVALFKWTREKWENRHVKYDSNGRRIWERVKEKEPSIIVEFVKAKYNKYCPKIDWID